MNNEPTHRLEIYSLGWIDSFQNFKDPPDFPIFGTRFSSRRCRTLDSNLSGVIENFRPGLSETFDHLAAGKPIADHNEWPSTTAVYNDTIIRR